MDISYAHEAFGTNPEDPQGYAAWGCTKSMFANRISFSFDFRGMCCQNNNKFQWVSAILYIVCALTIVLHPPMPVTYIHTNLYTTKSRLFMTLKEKAFENIMGNGEMLLTGIFSFLHNIFYSIRQK